MNQNLKEDLKNLVCEGNIAKLPIAPLNNYRELKNILLKACGKYQRNTFIFPFSAQVVINRLLIGEIIDFKKEFQFFETPEKIADYMTSQIIGLLDDNIEFLEPQAGRGALINAVLKIRPNVNVTAIELSDLNHEILKELYPNINLKKADFLSENFEGKKFDLIVANPPFSKNQDIDHVKKMYSLLKKGGQLITIMSTSWTFGSQKKQVEFKNWLENEVFGDIIENGQGAFKTSGTMVSSVLVIINK